jgi:hypothetical protein
VGKVVRRARDENGELIGKVSNNPFLNTAVYKIQFDDDGPVERYHANAIAEHIFSQVDVDRYGVSMLDEIIAHGMDKDALRRHQAVHTDKHGNQRPVKTTKGWELLVRLKDTQVQYTATHHSGSTQDWELSHGQTSIPECHIHPFQ